MARPVVRVTLYSCKAARIGLPVAMNTMMSHRNLVAMKAKARMTSGTIQ